MTESTIFYIADFQIDLSRSVVIRNEQETQVEPKVLKVLLLLAQRQNEVVTHQEIMETVWQGMEVVPNALQRCIAILRKELGDDAKSPTIIATHPKIGYRLLAEVQWQSGETSSAQQPASSAILPLALGLLFLVSLVAVFWPYQAWQEQLTSHAGALRQQYTALNPLTHTDAHESHVNLSPDGRFLVFNRYAGGCLSHLWARNVENGEEQQLTAQAGDFGAVSFTPDGRELVFAAKNQCAEINEVTHANSAIAESENLACWSIATLDFARSLQVPQTPQFRYQCQAERLTHPKALANHQYVYQETDKGQNKLVHYNDLSKSHRPFYAPENQFLYHFDYHPTLQRFALFSRDEDFKHRLTLLDESGKLIRSEVIRHLPEMSSDQQLAGHFEPGGAYLLLLSEHQLYKLSFDGQLELIKTPVNNLISVIKHPTTSKLLAVQGSKDIDIALVTLNLEVQSPASAMNGSEDLNQVNLPFPTTARTSAQERLARFQPGGDRVAFVSNRSGNDQLWVWHRGKVSALNFAGQKAQIHGFSWSPDGTHLAWANGRALLTSDLSGNITVYNTDKPMHSVLFWYEDQYLLVLLNDPTPGGLYRLNIDTGELLPFGVNQVTSAWPVHNKLIFNNERGEVFSRDLQIENTAIKALPGLNVRALFVANDFMYGVPKNSLELNQYDLQGHFLKTVTHLKATAWKATDLSGDTLLVSQFIAINQEIVVIE